MILSSISTLLRKRLFSVAAICLLTVLLLLVVSAPAGLAQGPASSGPPMLWSSYYQNLRDSIGQDFVQSPDGSYFIVGDNSTSGQVILIKADRNGKYVRNWSYAVGLDPTISEYRRLVTSLQQIPNGRLLISGYVEMPSSPKGPDTAGIFLLKVDYSGYVLMNKFYPMANITSGCAMQTSDGGHILVGANDTALHAIRTDSQGKKTWDRQYDDPVGLGRHGGHVIDIVASGMGYVVSGSANTGNELTPDHPATVSRAFLMKLRGSDGVKMWGKTYPAPGQTVPTIFAYAFSLINDKGGILAVCTDWHDNFTSTAYLVRVDSGGNTTWSRPYSLDGYGLMLESLSPCVGGGYVLSGGAYTAGTGLAPTEWAYVTRLSDAGDPLWNRSFGRIRNTTISSSARQVQGGAFVSTGYQMYMNDTGIWHGRPYILKIRSEDYSPPAVIATSPKARATGVPLSTKAIVATFNKSMDPYQIGNEMFDVMAFGGYRHTTGTLSCNGANITFRPDADLEPCVQYIITVRGMKDLAGNAMKKPYNWTFTTACDPAKGNIIGLIYRDVNNDGFPEPDEPGISGATVRYRDLSGQTITLVTDKNGLVRATGLAPGNYVVYKPNATGTGTTPVTVRVEAGKTVFLYASKAAFSE